ncbi:MAG: 3-keto-5-aminohexanoate cleavage protein, partial [Pseudomonas sp.]
PMLRAAYSEMTVPAGPGWLEEHLRRLRAANIQPHFQLAGIHSYETLERMIRRGAYMGPVNLTWIGIAGGVDGPSPYNFMQLVNRAADGICITAESLMKMVLPFNMMSMAMGFHPRCGIEDTLIGQHGQRMTSVQQIEQLVRVAHELGRDVANGQEARDIYKIGVQYHSIDETLTKLGMAPNRKPGQKGMPLRA